MEKTKGYKLFLIDATGAVFSVLFLSLLYSSDEFFGMPKSVIKIFILIATTFFVYSSTTYFVRPANWKFYLKIMATLNISYCLFTGYQILQNLDNLTLYGYIYFVAEILVILILSTYEINNVRRTTTR
jgi:hypothetical protein